MFGDINPIEEIFDALNESGVNEVFRRLNLGMYGLHLNIAHNEATELINKIDYLPENWVCVGLCKECNAYVIREETIADFHRENINHIKEYHPKISPDEPIMKMEKIKGKL